MDEQQRVALTASLPKRVNRPIEDRVYGEAEREKYKKDHDLHMKILGMDGSFLRLCEQRSAVQGGDLVPGFDEIAFWLVVVQAHHFLEVVLKLLVAIGDIVPDYLDKPRSPNGKQRQSKAEKDGHHLHKVFGRLCEREQTFLRDMYSGYTSFLSFLSPFIKGGRVPFPESIDAYLETFGHKDAVNAWKYAILEKGTTTEIVGLPSCSPDMLLEIIRGCLGLLEDKCMDISAYRRTLYRRLTFVLDEALNHPSPLGPVDVTDLADWRRAGPGVINAFSRYIRVGVVDDYSPTMRKWLDDSIIEVRKIAKDRKDMDLERFISIAVSCCISVSDNGRFSVTSRRPDPINSDPSLHRDWTGKWHGKDGFTWEGDVGTGNLMGFTGIPTVPGRLLSVNMGSRGDSPRMRDMPLDAEGTLELFLRGSFIASLEVVVISTQGEAQRWSSTMGDDPLGAATLMLLDADGNRVSLDLESTCPSCRGTGFCPSCKGDAVDSQSCLDCLPEPKGLCAECHGHGEEMTYKIVPHLKFQPC